MDNIKVIHPSIEVMEETRQLIALMLDYSNAKGDGIPVEWRAEAKTIAMKLAAMSGQTFMVSGTGVKP